MNGEDQKERNFKNIFHLFGESLIESTQFFKNSKDSKKAIIERGIQVHNGKVDEKFWNALLGRCRNELKK
jgi:hypothetical protein